MMGTWEKVTLLLPLLHILAISQKSLTICYNQIDCGLYPNSSKYGGKCLRAVPDYGEMHIVLFPYLCYMKNKVLSCMPHTLFLI